MPKEAGAGQTRGRRATEGKREKGRGGAATPLRTRCRARAQEEGEQSPFPFPLTLDPRVITKTNKQDPPFATLWTGTASGMSAVGKSPIHETGK